jgi:hypothetical protein
MGTGVAPALWTVGKNLFHRSAPDRGTAVRSSTFESLSGSAIDTPPCLNSDHHYDEASWSSLTGD